MSRTRPSPSTATGTWWRPTAAIAPLARRRRRRLAARAAGQCAAAQPASAGLAPRIVNLAEWRAHLLERLRRQNETFADPALEELERELRSYPGGVTQTRPIHNEGTAIAHMLKLRVGDATLSLISTITVFGTPLDVTLSELAIESFFPADEATRMALERLSMASA